MGSKVALWNQLSRHVVIDPAATKGAQVGVNLLDPSGKLVNWSDILNTSNNSTTGDLSNSTTDDLDEGAFNFYFTADRFYEALKDDAVESANVSVTFDDSGQTATFDLTDVSPTVGGTLSKWGFDSKGRLAAGDTASTSDLPEGSNLYFTNARAQDATGLAIAAGAQSGISVTYNGGTHSIDFTVTGTDFAAKAPVAYAATAALPANTYSNGSSGVGATLTGTANGPLLIDGVTMLTANLGERVLVAAESASANNGWYTITQIGVVAVSPYILTRSTDADTAAEIGPGYLTGVEAPSGITPGSNNGKLFISVAPVPFVVGTSALLFSGVGGTYSASTGLTLTGTAFSITNTAVSAGTYGDSTHVGAFTVNAQGQLTSASNVAISGSGSLPIGSQIGYARAVSSTAASGTAVLGSGPSNTIPVITDGTSYPSLSTTYAASSATSLLEIEVVLPFVSASTIAGMAAALFSGSTTNAIAANAVVCSNTNYYYPIIMKTVFVAGTTSSITYSVRFGPTSSGPTVRLGSLPSASSVYGAAMVNSMTIREIKQ